MSPPPPTPDSTLRVYELRRSAGSDVFNMLDAIETSHSAVWSSALAGRAPPTAVTRLQPELSAVAADAKSVLLSGAGEGAIDVAVELPEGEKGSAIYRFDRREDFASPLSSPSSSSSSTVVAAYDPLSSLIVRKAKVAGLGLGPSGAPPAFMELVDLKAMTSRTIHIEPSADEDR